MGVRRSQIQNLIILAGDIIGITLGYFLMTYMRFYGYFREEWLRQSTNIIYRWLISLLMLILIYMLFNPNKDFFKRKFHQEFVCNVETNAMLAVLMATIAYLIDDARDYSRFIYLMTVGFSFCWMQISHCIYRWYVLKY